MSDWSKVEANVMDKALSLARGRYQRNVVRGCEAISGSTLRGKARKYAAHYARSRRNLFARLTKAGLVVAEERGAHNKRILVIAAAAH